MRTDFVLLGENVKKFRRIRGLTQGQLSEAVECSDRHIGQIETAKSIPSLDMICRIADALDVTLDQLLGNDWESHVDSFVREIINLLEDVGLENKLTVMRIIKAIVWIFNDPDTIEEKYRGLL